MVAFNVLELLMRKNNVREGILFKLAIMPLHNKQSLTTLVLLGMILEIDKILEIWVLK